MCRQNKKSNRTYRFLVGTRFYDAKEYRTSKANLHMKNERYRNNASNYELETYFKLVK